MRSRVPLTLLVACLLLVPQADAAPRLQRFHTCPSLIQYGNRHIAKYLPSTTRAPGAQPTPVSMGGGSDGPETAAPAPAAAPVAGEDFSTTNNQEAGVDEPDVVKTDGRVIYAFEGSTLHAVDVTGTPKAVGSLSFGDGDGFALLIKGDRALVTWERRPAPQPVVAGSAQVAEPAPAPAPMPYPGGYRPTSVLGLVDLSDPAHMHLLRTMTVDGSLIDSRLTGATARVVFGTTPRAVETKVSHRRAAAWLPAGTFLSHRTHTRRRHALVACRSTRHPKAFSGLDMITVLTIDLAKGLDPVDSDALMTAGDTVYASDTRLYVASQRFVPQLWRETSGPVPDNMTTQIHAFDISDPDRTSYLGSGAVPGFLLSQFSMSEAGGVLRVASTGQPAWFTPDGSPQQSFVTTLTERDHALAPLGQVGGIGSGERIYGVRFLGDAGYVVTFRQVDPLFTLDLSNPAHPRVAGELKLLGYSAYLHPVGKDRLLGVGVDASDQGRVSGAAVSLFDVSDLKNPKLLQHYSFGDGSSSEADFDHHAFLWWAPRDLAVLPVTIWETRSSDTPPGQPEPPMAPPQQAFTGAIGLTVKDAGIAEAGRVTHATGQGYGPQVTRSLVVGNRLFTLSAAGLKATRLDGFADDAWVPFGQG